MGAALMGVDVVGEGVHRLLIGGVPLHRQLQAHLIVRAVWRGGVKVDDRRIGLVLTPIEVLDIIDQAPIKLEPTLQSAAFTLSDRIGVFGVDRAVVLGRLQDVLRLLALISYDDLDALVEESHLAQPIGDRLQRIDRGLEDLW